VPKVPVFNIEGEAVGERELKDSVFGVPVNEGLLHEVVVMYQANQRVGAASTKRRGEVRGGGRKPWRQKGTGRARHGSIRSPLWRGGGITFGPKPRDYGYRLPKKAVKKALKCALSAKVRDQEMVIVEDLSFDRPRTQEMARILANLKQTGKALIVTAGLDENVYKSTRNIPGVDTMRAEDLNAYQVVAHDSLIMTSAAVDKVEEVLDNGQPA